MEACHVFRSELGWMGVVVRGAGLWRLIFDQSSSRAVWRLLGEPQGSWDGDGFPLEDLTGRLGRYAQGEVVSWSGIPIDWSGLTPFQVRVLQACRGIPRGQTRSYAELAREVGSARAARAVGCVMARNRLPLIIPCHRVVGSRGALGGFSSRTGLAMKRRLLQLEAPPGTHFPGRRIEGPGRARAEVAHCEP